MMPAEPKGSAMRLIALMRRLTADRRGLTAITVALCLPLVVGAGGMGVEVGYWYFAERRLQTAADLAANAGAIALRAGGSHDVVEAAAGTEAAQNHFDPATGEMTVHTPPTSGSHQTNRAVEVLLESSLPRYFTSLF